MALTLRNVVNRPLTNQEVDDNFTYLETSVASNIETIDKDSLIVKSHSDNLSATGYTESYALDGNTLVTGDGDNGTSGAVYVYYDLRNGTANGADLTITSSDYRFGKQVAIQDNLLVVSSGGYDNTNTYQFSGRVYIYDITSSTPTTPIFTIDDPNAAYSSGFGYKIAFKNNLLLVSAKPGGSPTNAISRVYAYEIDITQTSESLLWSANAPTSSNEGKFGETLAFDANYAYVADSYTNKVHIYEIDSGNYVGDVGANVFQWKTASRPQSCEKFTADTKWYSWSGKDSSGNYKVWVWAANFSFFHEFDTSTSGATERAVGTIYDNTLAISSSLTGKITLWDIPSRTVIAEVDGPENWALTLSVTLNDNWLAAAIRVASATYGGKAWELKSSLGSRVNSIEAQSEINGVLKIKEYSTTYTNIGAQEDHTILVATDESGDLFQHLYFDEDNLVWAEQPLWTHSSGYTTSVTRNAVTDLSDTATNDTFGTGASIAGPYVTIASNVDANNSPIGRLSFIDKRDPVGWRQLARHNIGAESDQDFGTTIRSFYGDSLDPTVSGLPETFYIAAKQSMSSQNGYIHVYTDPIGDSETKPISQALYGSTPTTSPKGFTLNSSGSSIRSAAFDFTSDGKRVVVNTGGALYFHSTSKGDANNTVYDPITDADDSVTTNEGSFSGLWVEEGRIITAKVGLGTGNTVPTVVVIDELSLEIEKELTVPEYEFFDANVIDGLSIDLSNVKIDNNRLYVSWYRSRENELTNGLLGRGITAIYDINTWKLIRTIDVTDVKFVRGNFLIATNPDDSTVLDIYRIETKNDIVDLSNVSNTVTTLTADSVNQRLQYTDEDGTLNNIDLSWAVDDTNLARLTSGSLNNSTGIATFTRDDASTFTVDFSALFDDTDTNYYVDSASFSGGTLTLGRSGPLSDITVSLDGRYLTVESDTLDSVTSRGATTTNDLSVGAVTVNSAATLDSVSATSTSANISFPATRNGAKLLVSLGKSGDADKKIVTELLVTHDNTDVYITEYGNIYTSDLYSSYSIDGSISGGNVTITVSTPGTTSIIAMTVLSLI